MKSNRIGKVLGLLTAFSALWLAMDATPGFCGQECPALTQPSTEAEKSAERQAAAELMTKLKTAIQSGAKEFRIPAGKYRFDYKKNAFAMSSIIGAKNLTVDARGAIFIYEAWSFGLLISECENLTIDGLVIDYDPLPYTQGVITAIHVANEPFSGKNYFEYRQDSGYPRLEDIDFNPVLQKGVDNMPLVVFDDAGNHVKMWRICHPGKLENLGNGQYRVYYDTDAFLYPDLTVFTNYNDYGLKAGDRIAILYREAAAVVTTKCSNVSFKNVVMYSSPGGGFSDVGVAGWQGNTVFEGCKMLRLPGSNRLMSTNSDSFHSQFARRGPTLINCEASYVGDDFLNIRGALGVVISSRSDKQLIINMRGIGEGDSILAPGTKLRILGRDSCLSRGDARIVTVKKCDDTAYRKISTQATPLISCHFRDANALYLVELDKSIQAGFLDYVSFPDNASSDFKVSGCKFAYGAAHGIVIQTSNGIVENSSIAHTAGEGLVVSALLSWLEGNDCTNIVIRDNTVTAPHSVQSCSVIRRRLDAKAGAISEFSGIAVLMTPRLRNFGLTAGAIHSGITLENNQVINGKGPAVYINNARDIKVRNNRLIRDPQLNAEIDKLGLPHRNTPVKLGSAAMKNTIVEEDNSASESLGGK